MISQEELDFLRESNNIEDEWDDKSLQDAVLAWQYCKKYKKLTRKVILDVHGLLMQSRTTLAKKDKGTFRDGPVWIGGHEAPPFYTIENRLADWLTLVNDHSIPTHKNEILAKDLHVKYEGIHPFFDGNGRTGRIFYEWYRLKISLPIHVIEEKTKYERYYTWFTG